METAKEELQSGNEELTTVNDELQTRSVVEFQTNNDLINLLGSVEIPIVMLGGDHKIRRFTPLAGKALNLLMTDIGRPLSDLKLNFTSPHSDIDLEKMVSATIETLLTQEVEVQNRLGQWFRLQVRPYKTTTNKIDGAVLTLVDINSLRQSLIEVQAAKGEAVRANRAKDLFLATLSHELRTPLTAILSWTQLLRSGKLNAEKSRQALDIIEESCKTQAQLINDLLDVSRIVAGKIVLETREVSAASIMMTALEAVSPTAAAKSIQIETSFAPKVGNILADPVRLQQVFWNLLTNAIKFSNAESKISIKIDQVAASPGKQAGAMIKVEDSGKGIDSAFLPQIFDRFSQEDSSAIRVHGGLGLGLAIVRDLVELHGGTITAESQGENRGACFTIIIPIKQDYTSSSYLGKFNPPDTKTTATKNPAVRLDGIRVLIVDDEDNVREAYCALLGLVGADVKGASSAKEGFSLFGEFKPDVLVSDISMPGEDGYSLIKKIRALGPVEGGKTPALAITANAGENDIQQSLSAGFQVHLSKPVDSQLLAAAITKLVGKSLRVDR